MNSFCNRTRFCLAIWDADHFMTAAGKSPGQEHDTRVAMYSFSENDMAMVNLDRCLEIGNLRKYYCGSYYVHHR